MRGESESFERFYQILLWPLELTAEPDTEALKESGWSEIRDLKNRGTAEQEHTPYEEFVYFHVFAQRFLYSGKDFKGAFTLWARRDIAKARVIFHEGGEATLNAERVHLYLFARTRVAIVVAEVSASGGIARETVLRLEDELRRIYPPYWWRPQGAAEWRGGHCPAKVEWLDKEGEPLAASDYGDTIKMRGAVDRENRPPVAAHWNMLAQCLNYEQITDDRAPCMVFLEHRNPPLISETDLVRHCFYDGPGDGAGAAPYSPEFLANYFPQFSYGRFWRRDPSPHNWMKTLYLCCGYGFTAITNSGGAGLILPHFRHHYFQLGLLAHYHHASLLRFSSRFNEVMSRGAGPNDHDYWRRIREVRKEFAEFISTSWFHEVSNQEQGRELFELWTRHLRTNELMANICREAEQVERYLEARHEEETRAADAKLSEDVRRLTVLLYVLAAATLLASLLDADPLEKMAAASGYEWWFWPPMTVMLAAAGCVSWYLYRRVMGKHANTGGKGGSG